MLQTVQQVSSAAHAVLPCNIITDTSVPVEDLVSYIKPRLAESNGDMQGFLTESEFISAIQEESNRQIGCFLGGAGELIAGLAHT